MIPTKKRLRLCNAFIALLLVFIWGNSLLPGEISQAISDGVKALLSMLLSGGSSVGGQGSGLLRKIAHFTEFTALGALLGWLFGMLNRGKLLPFGCGVLTAAVDETIQRFVPDRGPSIWDVCLDSCGVLTGIVLLYLGHTYFKKRSANKPFLEDT